MKQQACYSRGYCGSRNSISHHGAWYFVDLNEDFDPRVDSFGYHPAHDTPADHACLCPARAAAATGLSGPDAPPAATAAELGRALDSTAAPLGRSVG